MPVSTVQSLIKRWKILGSLYIKPRSDRPRKISAKTARRIVPDAKKNPQVTSGEIWKKMVWLLQGAQYNGT
ncbi:hypothetical protein FQN60_010114 [Etheostoma spectabile]|uniref:Transposase Tc1-like domain-containing protein n=1 Tax=Etheostoma spectabile TaxID=54343 RepID=A0A5J5D5R8_9PERO|nr:hypothetical protein FQN60_010114 [Etheostoma spectabile]